MENNFNKSMKNNQGQMTRNAQFLIHFYPRYTLWMFPPTLYHNKKPHLKNARPEVEKPNPLGCKKNY